MLKIWVKYLLIVIISLAVKQGITKKVHVIEFKTKPDFKGLKPEGLEDKGQLLRTNNLSFCFRVMQRFDASYYLIKTKFLELSLQGGNDCKIWIYLTVSNQYNTDTHDVQYFRIFKCCEPYTSGQWVSMCFNIRLYNNTQQIEYIQDGKVCPNRSYIGRNFEAFSVKQKLQVTEM